MLGLPRRGWERDGYDFSPNNSLFQCKFEFPHKRFLLAEFGGSHFPHFSTIAGKDWWTTLQQERYSTDYVKPHLQETQEIQLIFAQEVNGSTSWGVLLPMPFLPSWRQVGLNFLRERWCLFWVSNQLIVSSQLSAIPPSRYAMEDVGMFMHWALGYSHDFAFHKRRGRILVQEAVAFVVASKRRELICVFSDSCMRNTMST